jgi:hypothetical protein
MRVPVLAANLFLFFVSLFIALQNGFLRAAPSTWLFICITASLVFNIRAFFAYQHKKTGTVAASKPKQNYRGPEKRSHYRVVYSPNRRPWLVINDCAFEVTDISQKGLRFLNHKDVMFGVKLEGKITFTDGDSINIVGNIEWKKADQTSLIFTDIIPHSLIKKELAQLV